MMHMPMRFTFSKEAVDERAIMSQGRRPGAPPDGARHAGQADPVSIDVDFADASGKVFKSTYFEFDLQRGKGYFEAGEYTVSLAGPDGDVGGAQKLALKGDNPPVYRGAMDFGATTRRRRAIQNVRAAWTEARAAAAATTTTPSAAPMTTDVAPVGNAGHGSR